LLIGIIALIVVVIGISSIVFSDTYRSTNQCKSDCLEKGFEDGDCKWPREISGEISEEESLESIEPYYENVENLGPCVLTFTKHCGNKGQCNCYCFNTTTTTQPTTTIVTTTTTTISSSGNSSEYCLDWDLFFDNAYKDGQVHEEIKRIQEKLGVEPVGGHYGPQSQAAIEAFNRKYKLYPNIFCCALSPEYKDINRGTIAKFNELYCNKPLYQISISINHASSSECPQEICPISVLISGYNSANSESISSSKVLKAPYSSSILIMGDPEGCKISKVYVNDQLAAYYERPQDSNEQYAEAEAQRYISINNKDFTFTYSATAGITFFDINKVMQDYNVQIETIGCKHGGG